MFRRTLFSAAAAGWLTLAGRAVAQPQRPAVRVAAASDLKFALDEVAARFGQETGVQVQLDFGSSGQFAQQIRQGLPVDLFLSADEDFVFQLADSGLTQDRGALYALGRIAFAVPLASAITLDADLRGLRANWAAVRSFAIANPEHAPYGRAAQQALERLGLWEMVKPKLVLGENIAQATQYLTSGAAQAGITALPLAMAPQVARSIRHVALAAALHAPLRQRMVLLKAASPQAVRFYSYLQAVAARKVLARYGFAFD